MPFKVDRNQSEIVREFRKLGAKVDITATVGNGFPDLVVNHKGLFAVIEVKDGTAKLRPGQKKWFAERDGLRYVVRDTEDVVAVLMIMEKVATQAKEALDDICDRR